MKKIVLIIIIFSILYSLLATHPHTTILRIFLSGPFLLYFTHYAPLPFRVVLYSFSLIFQQLYIIHASEPLESSPTR